jgi:Flp pilus assembly protein CpaB
MKKEIIIKSIMASVLFVLLIWLLAAAVDLRSVQKLNLRTTCIASRDIPPRTCITEEDLLEIKIPGDYLLDYTVTDKKEILGKYTDIQGKIPAGSAFYKDMLVKAEDLPDYPSAQLRDGQSAYTMETDLAKLGGVVVPGQRVDIYASFTAREGTTISGCIIENARIIAVKDHKGIDLDDPSSSGTPYLVILAVDQKDLPILTAADTAGTIRLFSSSRTYDSGSEAALVENTDVLSYIRELTQREESVHPDEM